MQQQNHQRMYLSSISSFAIQDNPKCDDSIFEYVMYFQAQHVPCERQYITILMSTHSICWKPPSPFSNVHFRNTTKILQHKFFTLKLLFIFTLSLLKVSFPQTMSLSCIFVFAPSFIRMDLSIVSTSTSLTFSEFLVLFSSISLLSSLIESHFALSSARCHL